MLEFELEPEHGPFDWSGAYGAGLAATASTPHAIRFPLRHPSDKDGLARQLVQRILDIRMWRSIAIDDHFFGLSEVDPHNETSNGVGRIGRCLASSRLRTSDPAHVDIRIEMLAPDTAQLTSRYRLDRPQNPQDGINTRLMRKRGDKWVIALNHVSSREVPCADGTQSISREAAR